MITAPNFQPMAKALSLSTCIKGPRGHNRKPAGSRSPVVPTLAIAVATVPLAAKAGREVVLSPPDAACGVRDGLGGSGSPRRANGRIFRSRLGANRSRSICRSGIRSIWR
jgi:hypothetical protein